MPTTSESLFPCPVCRNGSVIHHVIVKRLRPDEHSYVCTQCAATFRLARVASDTMPAAYQLLSYPDTHSDTAAFYQSQTRTPDEWQHAQIVPNSALDELETTHESLLDLTKPLAVNVPLVLQPNEYILFALPNVEYLEERSQRVMSLPGISSRIGNSGMRVYSPARYQIVEQNRHLDSGTFLLTNQRYCFIGFSKSVSNPIKKIVAVRAYQDGFSIARSGKQRVEFFLNNPGAYSGAMLKRYIDELNTASTAPTRLIDAQTP